MAVRAIDRLSGLAIRSGLRLSHVPAARLKSVRRLLLVVALVSACADADSRLLGDAPDGTYRLEPVTSFGWNELGDSTRPLTDRERLFEGAVFGNPGAMAIGKDGTLYVLDGAFKKIVVFSSTGEFERIIVGGAGKGPAEFGLPVSLTFGPGGDLWVWDLFLQRLTRFSPEGEHKHTAKVTVLPRMMTLIGTEETLYGARHGRDSVPMLVELDTLGNVIREFAFPSPGDLRITGREGLIPALGLDAQGRLLIGRPDVGTWSRFVSEAEAPVRGEPLFPGSVPILYTDPKYGITTLEKDAQPGNIGAFSDGSFFIRFLDNRVTRQPVVKLAIFDRQGALQTVIDSAGVGGTLGYHPDERAIYLAVDEPFPRVVKYALTSGDAR